MKIESKKVTVQKSADELCTFLADVKNFEVVLGAMSDKLPFTLTGNIAEVSDTTSEIELLFEGDFNPMMKMMIKGPITKFMETLATNLEKV